MSKAAEKQEAEKIRRRSGRAPEKSSPDGGAGPETPPAPKPFTLAVTTDFYKKALRLMAHLPELLAGENLPGPEGPAHPPAACAPGGSGFAPDSAPGSVPGSAHDAGLNAALAETGRLLGVSRVYVMLDEADGRYLRNTHEWVDGAIGPAMYSWPLHDYEKDLPSLRPMMAGKPFFAAHTRNVPPDFQRVLRMQAVDSVLLVPLLRDGKRIGLIGFDSCGAERLWKEEEIAILRHLARLVTLFMERREYDETRRMLDRVRDLLGESEGRIVRFRVLSESGGAKTPDVPDDALSLQEAERRLILDALALYNGNKSRAAKHLGLKWAALDRRCKKLGIEVEK